MKRLFVWMSTIFIALFLLLAISANKHVITFSSYESVDIIGKRGDVKTVSREDFTATLTKIADDSGSVIARRIVEPQQDLYMIFTVKVNTPRRFK